MTFKALPLWLAPLVTIAVLFGTVGVAMATGTWQPSGKVVIVAGEKQNPDELKGWMTLRQVAQAAGVEPAALVAEAGLPADVALDVPMRTLHDQVPGFEVAAVRDAVARLG